MAAMLLIHDERKYSSVDSVPIKHYSRVSVVGSCSCAPFNVHNLHETLTSSFKRTRA